MFRLAYLVFIAVLAASLCGCGGHNDANYVFDGDWDGTFSDTRVSAGNELTLDVTASNPTAPPGEREYTFTGQIWRYVSEPGNMSFVSIGTINGTITSQGKMTVDYQYGLNPSLHATGQAYVVKRPLLNGIPHMIGTIYTYQEGSGTLLAKQEFDLTRQTQ